MQTKNKPYLNLVKAYTLSEQEQPPAHISKLLADLQAVVNRAYQDGYEAGAKSISEDADHE